MAKKMLIDATHAEETRVVVVDGTKVDEFDFESASKRQLAGNIYLAKVTRVEPSLQAAFVDYGGNRHGFLAFNEIHPDYYQIPKADREALLAEEMAQAKEQDAREAEEAGESDDAEGNGGATDGERPAPAKRGRSRSRSRRRSSARSDEVESGATEPEASDEAEAASRGDEAAEPGTSDPGDAGTASVQEKGETDAPAEEEPADDSIVKQAGGGASGIVSGEAPDLSDAADRIVEEERAPENSETDGSDGEPVVEGTGESEGEDEPEDGDHPDARPRGSMAEDTGLGDESVSEEVSEDQGHTTPENAGAGEADAPEAEARPERRDAAGMEVLDLDDGGDADRGDPVDVVEGAGAAADEGSAEDEVAEARAPRKPRPRRYKIQEVIKVRQIMLVQVVKEERGNKGAALTTYLSLAGRYCVLMPNTARGGGISRKITSVTDRKKLKDIASEMDVPRGAGLIIRTAGAKRTKTEIKRDYEYLQRQWEQIRELTLKSIAPAPIYEEGNLIHRSIRDLYTREIDEVIVAGETGYRQAKEYMKLIMPSHAKNVHHHGDPLPLFARYGVDAYLDAMFNPTVQLPSGGYIVIGITEALVAIDVNSGKATKEGSIEETALKTNLEAAEEVARQMRLRDLAGLIVIDFIDMDERRNNAAVEKRLKDALKHDRARIQIGRISSFGLLEMSRQRMRPGMLEATTQPCSHCHGTGLLRSDNSVALQVLRAVEEEGARERSREVLLKLPVGVANYLVNDKREHLAVTEARWGLSIRIEADASLTAPDWSMEKLKTASRTVPKVAGNVVQLSTSLADMDEPEVEEDELDGAEAAEAAPLEDAPVKDAAEDDRRGPDAGDGEGDAGETGGPRKKRRRRSRRRKGGGNGGAPDAREGSGAPDAGEAPAEPGAASTGDSVPEPATPDPATPQPASAQQASGDAETKDPEVEASAGDADEVQPAVTEAPSEEAPVPAEEPTADVATEPADVDAPEPDGSSETPQPASRRKRARAKAPAPSTEPSPEVAEVATLVGVGGSSGDGAEAPAVPEVAESPSDSGVAVDGAVGLDADGEHAGPAEVATDADQADAGDQTVDGAEAAGQARPKRVGWWRAG